jgi:hypothetical protein
MSLSFLWSYTREYLFPRTCTSYNILPCWPGCYRSMSHVYMCVQKDTQTYDLSRTHKKLRELVRQNCFFGLVSTPVRLEFCSPWRSYHVVACVDHGCLCRRIRSDSVLYPTHSSHPCDVSRSLDVREDVVCSNLPKFTSLDDSKVGCMFSQKNRSTRRFFTLTDKFPSQPRENQNGKVGNGIGLMKTLTRTILIKTHTVWQEYYKENPKILTDYLLHYPFGTLVFILLTHEQELQCVVRIKNFSGEKIFSDQKYD